MPGTDVGCTVLRMRYGMSGTDGAMLLPGTDLGCHVAYVEEVRATSYRATTKCLYRCSQSHATLVLTEGYRAAQIPGTDDG
eukprot:1068884-Rhodomonas_salina.2